MSTDDESFHPLGDEWEDELETMLDDTEYDSQLGMDMARDAMRVTKGELSEAKFHEKYHEDVMEEFGEDERPTKEAYEAAKEETKGTVSRMLSKFDGDGEETRRETMKKMGVGAAAVGVGAFGDAVDGPQSLAEEEGPHSESQEVHERDVQWGMTIDLERCDGCLSCMTACTEENDLDQGVNWMYVMAFEDELTSSPSPEPTVEGGNSDFNMLVRPCQHCTDAPCEKVCPTTARHTRDKDGLVLTDYDVCIGCRYCQVACPYGVNYFQWDEPDTSYDQIADNQNVDDSDEVTHAEYDHGERWVDSRSPRGTMSKCTMCPSHQDGNRGDDMRGTTACEEACPPNAIQFGNVKDEKSDASQHREHPIKSRAVIDVERDVPSVDTIDENLSEDDDLASATEAVEDLDTELVSIMKAIEIASQDTETDPGEEENNTILQKQETILESLEALEQYVDLESEDVLTELRLGSGEAEDAQVRLQQFAGNPSAKFKLLEDIGTHPNITYLGQEPGPEAEQVDGPTKYEDVGLTDKRQDVLDEGTVGHVDGVSL
ncbi:4Fe-4S ferredoxin N-terminal domain-containing protein [Natrinema salifodinae]|uniref:Prokaryotic molybdopterin-containing oxidoreductase family, iron-sulfur binding subunit n=1 Tax=Natrinema salifodinae TaxID=1202768 RepID=A0A1I0MYZ0_9EURY|nr:4Fe-4S ferredoxin N-terminal domain-containing protein [Natrinema salifodinae]SEV93861.1 prokaryotic molybdopterin-containing oxidoreductase family, iron-sulfur binding subunit [Natrinema salifodinae]